MPATRRGRARAFVRSIGVVMLLASAIAIGGCHRPRYEKRAWMVTEGDASRYLKDALDQPNPDHRRDAIQQLAKTRFADHDVVVDTCLLIARKDASEHVRCAALGLAACSKRKEVSAALLAFVEARVSSRTASCGQDGLDALNGLLIRAESARLTDEQIDRLVRVAATILRQDKSRDVRITCAKLLGNIKRRASVTALVGALNDADFGLVYEAERSLMRLTGVTRQHDARGWQAWMRSTPDWFAKSGALDAKLSQPEPKHWWQFGRSSASQSMAGGGAS